MRWNDEDYTTGKPVVRMLSFCKKTEDGDIIDVAAAPRPRLEPSPSSSDVRRTSNEFGSLKSLTSIDVKKSRRTSSTLQRNPPPTRHQSSLLKSNSFSTKEPTKYEQLNARALRTEENPPTVEKRNKLILRVPSAADEHENKKVIYSVCGEVDEGDEFQAEKQNTVCNVNEPRLKIANQKSLNSSSNGITSGGVSVISNLIDSNVPYLGVDKEEAIKNLISCENSNVTTGTTWEKSKSTTNLIITPKSKPIFRRKDFSMKNGTINSCSSELELDFQERWRIPATDPSHNSSDVGSRSLSNFSSGDGLSTPSHMGSTSRLIYQKKIKKRWKCGSVENFSTLMSILAFAGSLANVMRLPRMVYFHGGGTFLLIYTLITLLFGIPLAFLEIGLGQFCQHGTVKIWRAVSLFKGVGYTKVLISFVISVYYAIHIAVAGSLLIWDLKEPLPLSKCFVPAQLTNSTTGSVPERNKDCSLLNFWISISEDPSWFWINIICLFLIWSLLIVCVLKRSKSFRRTIYITLTTTIVLLIILIVEASTRTTEGISKLLVIRWSKFFDVQVWYFTVTQMLMSTQIGFGNISTSAGRLFPKTNAFWSALALIFGNLIIGYMSVSVVYLWIGQIEEAGFSLSPSNVTELFVFDIIYNMSVGSVSQWASVIGILGYIMVICAGLTSTIILTYSTLVAIAIEAKKKWHWWHITVIICFFAFFVGIVSTIPANLSIPHVLEHYVVAPSLLGLTCLEVIGFAYFYGMKNLYQDFEFVVGTKMGNYWRIVWFLIPIVLIIIASCSLSMLSLKGESPIQDDTWEYSLGWSLYLVTWFIIIVTAFYQIYKQVDYNITQKFLSSIKPSRNWGPVDPIYRHCWVQWRNRYQMTGRGDFSLKRRGTRDYTLSVRSHGSLVDCSREANPSNDWTYVRSISSGPYHLHKDGNHHICWRKDENF